LARAGFVDAIEALEDSREILGRDAYAGVGYPYGDAAVAGEGNADANFAIGAIADTVSRLRALSR